jgi:hypothetical protein
MSALFSIVFTGIFAAFIIAALVGHALLIGALLRPFFGRPILAPILIWHGQRARQPAH